MSKDITIRDMQSIIQNIISFAYDSAEETWQVDMYLACADMLNSLLETREWVQKDQ